MNETTWIALALILLAAVIPLAFVCGVEIGRLQADDEARRVR